MRSKYFKVRGVRVKAHKPPENKITWWEKHKILGLVQEGVVSGTFDGIGWWIVAKIN